MSKKIIYLLIALCLPALIFVFLKFFGKNQFDIPVYFKDGVEEAPRHVLVITQSLMLYPIPS
jgi:hypothetical protein